MYVLSPQWVYGNSSTLAHKVHDARFIIYIHIYIIFIIYIYIYIYILYKLYMNRVKIKDNTKVTHNRFR